MSIGAFNAASPSDSLDGNMRDVRIYDYALSAERAASLYSGTYPQTPDHWWKIDEGSGSAVEDYGTGTDADGTITGATYTNGTLDLDGTLTIAANGTLSAPRGNLDLAGNFENAGSFTNNSGTVVTSTLSFNLSSSVDPVFFNLTNNGTLTLGNNNTRTFSIQGTHAGTGHTRPNGIITLNYGTTTTAGSITNTGYWLATNNNTTTTIQGVSSLFPVLTSSSNNWGFGVVSGEHWKWANLNFVGAFASTHASYSNDTTHTLLGDCEFDAVTVSSGDTLDLNGQRAVIDGVFDVDGSIDADGMLILNNKIDYDGQGFSNAQNCTMIFRNTTGGTIFNDSAGVTNTKTLAY